MRKVGKANQVLRLWKCWEADGKSSLFPNFPKIKKICNLLSQILQRNWAANLMEKLVIKLLAGLKNDLWPKQRGEEGDAVAILQWWSRAQEREWLSLGRDKRRNVSIPHLLPVPHSKVPDLKWDHIVKLFWMIYNVGDLRVVPLVYGPLTSPPCPISVHPQITFFIICQVWTWTSQFTEDRNMVFGVMSKFMQFQIYFKPKFPVLLHIKEFCKVKISIFTRNTILWPHFPDGWDDAHAQI